MQKKFFLYFGKWSFLDPSLQKSLYFFSKNVFLTFQEGTCKVQKTKRKFTLKKFLTFLQKTFSPPFNTNISKLLRNNKINLLLSWLETFYVLKNRFINFSSSFSWQFLLQYNNFYTIKSSLKFLYSIKQSQHLYLILQVLLFLSSCQYLHLILRIPSERLLTRFDNELVMNLPLSINCNL